MNRPLSRSERQDIEAYYAEFGAHGSMIARYLEQYMAAEAFWREAVRNAKPDIAQEYGNDYELCPWCGCKFFGTEFLKDHKPDCPWLLAQES